MSERIVLVEDSQVQAMRIQLELLRYGFNVDIAHTGAQGLALIRANHPAAVVLDVNLPDMDGYTLCRTLKGDLDTARIPIIMLTVRSEEESTMTGLHVGAEDYIPKDMFALQNLVESLRQMGIEGAVAAAQHE
jgi:DNA-binding response OmpR family regulator